MCYCCENIKLTILKESTQCLLTNHYNDNLLNDWYVTSMLTNMILSHYVIVKYAGFLLMVWCLFGARWCILTGIHQYQVMTWIVTQFQEMSLWNGFSSDTRTSSNSSLCIIHEMVMGFACISRLHRIHVIETKVHTNHIYPLSTTWIWGSWKYLWQHHRELERFCLEKISGQ